MRQITILFWASLALGLSACSDKPDRPPYAGVKIGKPYQIYGRWYKPAYQPGYDEVGVASWYGPGFHGGKTANGEQFDQNDMTAAHRTLPLPSIVRVTNLMNGQSAIIKVNDRGPFSKDRILDLSKGSAAKLGIIANGTAKVRVQFLEEETKKYVENSNTKGISYAMAELQGVDPVRASDTQERNSKPKFYVMKVPEGQKAPPESVLVSENDAAQYPTRNIFDPADREENKLAKESPKSQSAPVELMADARQPARHGSQIIGSGNNYYIQAGTFGQVENAQRLAARLNDFDTRIVNLSKGERTLYRVVLGPYPQPTEAKNQLSKLSTLGISGAKIVHE